MADQVIKLKRLIKTDKSTIGELSFGSFKCFTLEDVEREKKIPGRTAIPKGKYEIVITWSPKFQRDLPLLLNVPNFSSIRLHSGNTSDNTEGCILVGTTKMEDFIGRSKEAFLKLYPLIQESLSKGKLWIEIS